MEKCPQCHFRKVQVKTVRNPVTRKVIESSSVCKQCGYVLRSKKHETD